MSTSLTIVHFSTIQRLQEERSSFRPGSENERIADYAIDLCLNPGRTAEDAHHLHRNVRRDAKKHLYRGGQRETQANARALATQGYTRDYADELGYTTSGPSAEDECLAQHSDLCDAAHAFAPMLGPWGPQFLTRLLEGSSIDAAASVVGVSRATGYRAKQRLAAALAPLRPQEAA
ncbi:hypothetical protein [Kocuria sabuli]|uniref:hypothetical protein n=1 Tax=Kocuria sabuli TaxID=3071448 RepID=UPI0034D6C5BB